MKITAILLIAIILLVACASGQNGDNIVPENQRVENEVSTSERRLIPDNVWEEYLEQHIRTNVGSVTRGDYTPADRNIDLQRIERFVFFDNINDGGYGFVLDRLHNNRVYYDSSSAAVERLGSFPYSAEFREEDLDRLIAAIEQSGLRDWDYHYTRNNRNAPVTASRAWMVGILFDDGTIMRRSGGGLGHTGMLPPDEQWAVLVSFIGTIGAEIQERQAAEERDRDMQEIERFLFSYSTSGRFRLENASDNFWIGYEISIDRANGFMRYSTWKDYEYRDIRDGRVRDESEFLAVFSDEDLERLIDVIEQSGVLVWGNRHHGALFIPSGDPRPREWEDRYFDYIIDTSGLDLQRHRRNTGWSLIITLEDGTTIQRRGGGETIESIPSTEEFMLLLDFVHAMGQEIQEQHNARLNPAS